MNLIADNSGDNSTQSNMREQLWYGVPFKQALQDAVARHQTGYKYEELKEEIKSGEDLLDQEEIEEVDKFVNLLMHMFVFYHSYQGGEDDTHTN
jgi:hypothetical protein